MSAKNLDDRLSFSSKKIYAFVAGAAVGGFMLTIPYWFSAIESSPLHIGISILLVLTCGILAGLLGEKFIQSLAQAMSDSGL